jgi:hypothetical protein
LAGTILAGAEAPALSIPALPDRRCGEDGDQRRPTRRERAMRYTLLIYTNEADRPEWGTPEGDAEAKGYNDFHGEVTQRGVLRGGEPLLRVAAATSVRVRNGSTQISDGPAVQTPEQLGGWYLVECNDLDEALELAAKIPGASYGTIEVRPVLELPA